LKKLSAIIFLCFVFKIGAQPGLYRHLPQTQASYYFNCETKNPVKTQDGGYIFSYFPWSPNLHGISPADFYTIKTDSNFIPQWKKPYFSGAISLPTGGIILVYYTGIDYLSGYSGMHIEKVTVSGVQVWIKNISTAQATRLNDGVYYGNKVRFVGRKAGDTGYPYYAPTSQAYTLLMDTAGNFISHSLFNTSYSGDADFTKIERDSQGNFFVYSSDMVLSTSNMTIAKFDSNFSFVWGKTWSSSTQPLLLTDIDILPNGRIFATGMIRGNYPYNYPVMGALLKFDSHGNIVDQKFFDGRYKISGLLKKANGNYIVSSTRGFQDSLFMFETDTAMNIAWYKFCGRGTSIGTSIQKNGTLFTPTFYGSDPVIISNDLIGNSCASYSVAYSKLTSSVSLTNFSLSSVTSSAVINSGTINIISHQTYVDSCNCPVFISVNQNNFCVGNTGTISIVGTGNLSWYSTATGNSFIQSGPQFVYTSNTPTVKTVYVQDSACTLNLNRTQINIVVNALPTLTINPLNPTLCLGNSSTLTASGANTYTWNTLSNNSSIIVTPSMNTTYTVSGSSINNCKSSQTIALTVYPKPTVIVSVSDPDICIGENVTLLSSGAQYYSWNTGSTVNVIYQSPLTNTSYVVTGATPQGCTDTKTIAITVHSLPIITLNSSHQPMCIGESATLIANGANTYTWGSTVGASIVVSPTSNTKYYVATSDLYGCAGADSITQYVNLCTGIKSFSDDPSSITILPNPSQGIFTINLNSINEKTYFEIYNSIGQLIHSQKITELNPIIDLENQASGIYYLQILGQEGPLTQKLVKQ